MRLTDIRPCLIKMTPEEQDAFIEGYLIRRESDLSKTLVKVKTSTKKTKESSALKGKKDDMIVLTAEQLEIFRKLGLC